MPAAPPDSPNPFAAYHRARRRSAVLGTVAIGIPVVAVIASLCIAGSVGTAQATPVSSDKQPAIGSWPVDLPTPSPTPTSVRSAVPAPASAHVGASHPSTVRISITATGYQREIDECQWVKMDLGAEAPIVGAHTQCGGAVVLSMRPGELVDLSGQGLDGSYVVTDSRDAHSGDDAATATAGMQASVILQTCYPGTEGRERLVGLEPQN